MARILGKNDSFGTMPVNSLSTKKASEYFQTEKNCVNWFAASQNFAWHGLREISFNILLASSPMSCSPSPEKRVQLLLSHAAWFIATFMHLRTLAQLHSRLPHHEIPILSLLVTVLKTCAESKFKPVSVFLLSGSIVIENFEGKEGLLFSHLPCPDFDEHKS